MRTSSAASPRATSSNAIRSCFSPGMYGPDTRLRNVREYHISPKTTWPDFVVRQTDSLDQTPPACHDFIESQPHPGAHLSGSGRPYHSAPPPIRASRHLALRRPRMPTLEEPVASGTEMAVLLQALTALKKGQKDIRLPSDWTGIAGKVADAFNEVVEMNERLASELTRLSRVVGKEGKLSQRVKLGDVTGFWREKLESVNDLTDDLVHPTIETARVIGAVAQGDLSKTMALEIDDRPVQGEFLRTARTINTMVDQLSSFASEVTRVAREVGTEGKLGGQAKVKGVAGTWKDLTDSVNRMAGNPAGQVRNIAEVTTAVANGDLSRKITVDVKGEFL